MAVATHNRNPQRRARRKGEPGKIARESLERAVSGHSDRNDADVIAAFAERGIPVDQIRPRQNVFTFNAWKALGRQVRKGEKAVRLTTWIPIDSKRPDSGEGDNVERTSTRRRLRPKTAFVFHVSQTDPISE